MKPYETLDAILVVAALIIIAGLMTALVFVEIPTNNLPVLASLGATVVGFGAGYAAFRWGNSSTAKNSADTAQTAAATIAHLTGTGAGLGQPLAGQAPTAPADVANVDITADSVTVNPATEDAAATDGGELPPGQRVKP